MRYIQKISVPPELQASLEKALKKKLSWDNFKDEDGRRQLRAHLWKEQFGLCAYSEISLNEYGFHIDHIQPKGNSKYFHLRFDVNNLVASALVNQNCVAKKDLFGGHKKDNSEIAITPAQQNCNKHFEYTPTGMIQPAKQLTDQDKQLTEQVIDCLGLQCQLLINKRHAVYASINQQLSYLLEDAEALSYFINDYLEPNAQGQLKPFQSMAEQIFNRN